MKHGDFSSLADNYSKFRPGYSERVLDAVIGMLPNPAQDSVFADIGAGTGIWTRIVANRGFAHVYAVEPNENMRVNGIADSKEFSIEWISGTGESTGLPDKSIDLLTMASSFHWVDFDKGINEFTSKLKPGGIFVALWNPRLLKVTPVLEKIHNYMEQLKPDMKRISSGSSEFAEKLNDRLHSTGKFIDIVYVEAKHSMWMDKESYIGVWKSVNDVQVQLGEKLFKDFLDFIDNTLEEDGGLEAHYLTRAWCAVTKK